MKIRKIVKLILVAFIMWICLFFLEKLLMPKYMNEILEGALISEYYTEEVKQHDVVFIGDCEVYENFSPVTLWEEFGMTSFIRGSAQQLIWQSYYLMEETLQYETPKVMVFNVLSMKYDEPQNEAYNRMTLDAMPMSVSKLKSIKASMMEDEDWISYIFPILRYHSRWDSISEEDFEYLLKKKKISHNGYLMRVDEKAATTIPTGKKLANYKFSDTCYDYLDKMVELCKKNNIKLVLIKAPTIYPYWYEEWDEQIVNYAEENDLLYINFLNYTDEIGIDLKTDTYDGGLHLNLSGAEKLSRFFGKILKESFNLPDHRGEEELKTLWTEKTAYYDKMIDDQNKELEAFGYLRSFNAAKER